jgi:hypothetical protein
MSNKVSWVLATALSLAVCIVVADWIHNTGAKAPAQKTVALPRQSREQPSPPRLSHESLWDGQPPSAGHVARQPHGSPDVSGRPQSHVQDASGAKLGPMARPTEPPSADASPAAPGDTPLAQIPEDAPAADDMPPPDDWLPPPAWMQPPDWSPDDAPPDDLPPDGFPPDGPPPPAPADRPSQT